MNRGNLIIFIALFIFIGFSVSAFAAQGEYHELEELCYREFIAPYYPQGLRAKWGGIFSNYLPRHDDDDSIESQNKNHNVSIGSVNLLARYFLLIGDRAKFDEIFKLWAPPSLGGKKENFISPELQLTHWLLDSKGYKSPESDLSGNKIYICSTGEQLNIIVNLYSAHQKFASGEEDSKYKRLAKYLADGLRGMNRTNADLSVFSGNYLLKPLFRWDVKSKPAEFQPTFSNLDSNSLEAYYYIINWLEDPYYGKVLTEALRWIKLSQTKLGLFKTNLDLARYDFDPNDINNLRCNSLAGLKLSLDLVEYSKLSGDTEIKLLARKYLDFMIGKYNEEGRVYNSYFVDTGAPFSMLEGLAIYARLVNLAIEFEEYGFARTILEAKILPQQVSPVRNIKALGIENKISNRVKETKNPDDYVGAFKEEGDLEESSKYIRKDALAFHNLEVLLAIDKWNRQTDLSSKPSDFLISKSPSYPQLINIPLIFFVNNDGITDERSPDGDFDGYGWALFAKDLPESNSIFSCMKGDLRFLFPDKRSGKYNNIECLGQELTVPSGNYSCVHLLAGAHNGDFKEQVQLIYEDGAIETEELNVGDWWNEPLFGHTAQKGRCVNKGELQNHEVYLAHIKILTNPKKKLQTVRLPQRDNIHIFGITLERPSEVTAEELKLDPAAKKLIQTILDYQTENGLTSYKTKETIGGDYSWALFILSLITAQQNGYISRDLAVSRLTKMLETIDRLPKYQGWLYKYYDLRTEKPASNEIGFQAWYLFSLIVTKQIYPELTPICDKLLSVDYSIFYNSDGCFLYGDYNVEQKNGFNHIVLGPHKGVSDAGFAASERRLAYVVYTYLTGDKSPWYLDDEPPLQTIEGYEFLKVWEHFNFDIAHLHYALPEIGYYKKSWENFVEASKRFMDKNGLIFLAMREGKLEDLRDSRGYPNTEHREATPGLTWYLNKDIPVMEKAFTPTHGMWRYYDNCLFYWTYGDTPIVNGYIGDLPHDNERGNMSQIFYFNIDKDKEASIPPRLKSISLMTSIPYSNNPPYGNLTVWLNGEKITQIAPDEVSGTPKFINKDVSVELRGGRNVLVLKNDNPTSSENNIYYLYRYNNNLLNTEYGYDKTKFNLEEDIYGLQYTLEDIWVGNKQYRGSIVNIIWEGQKSGPEVEDTCSAFLVRCAIIHNYYVYHNLLDEPKFLNSLVAWVGDYSADVSIARTVYNVANRAVSVFYKRPEEWVNPSNIKVVDITEGRDISDSLTIENERLSWLALPHHAYSIEYKL